MARNVLVLNAGSSSLKYALYKMGEKTLLQMQGLVENLGTGHSSLKHKVMAPTRSVIEEKVDVGNHQEALERVVNLLNTSGSNSNGSGTEVAAVGHRVVHGGEAMVAPALITEQVKKAIQAAVPLAPLHNPPNLQGIKVAEGVFDCPQVAVFDTAFHATIPPHAFTYAIPYRYYQTFGIRRYGFHGTSYLYLLGQAAQMLGKPVEEVNIIACHLGAGASMAAIKQGKCIDTTMGVTPLEGLVMATRSGDIDPAVSKILADLEGLTPAAMDKLLNKESGLVGICGEKDMKLVVERAVGGDVQHRLALDVFVHRVRKYIGAFMVELEGEVDAVVFSAGIGERSAPVRARVCERLEKFGVVLDEERNMGACSGEAKEIQKEGAGLKLLVIPTDEELSIAQQTLNVVSRISSAITH